MINKINQIKEELEGLSATDLGAVEELRIKYLSKKGSDLSAV